MNRRLLFPCLLLFFCLSLPATGAWADSLTGIVELDYSRTSNTSTDSTGITTKSTADSLLQRYTLNLDRTIYPQLQFLAGGIFERDSTTTSESGFEDTAIHTSFNPTAELKLNTGLISAGIRYNRIQDKNESGQAPSLTEIRDIYDAIFVWRPVSLPLINVEFTRTNTYDTHKAIEDTVNDLALWSLNYSPSTYAPLTGLQIIYTGSYSDLKDKLEGLEIQQLSNTVRLTYSRQFFDRVSFDTSYNYSRQDTEMITQGAGQVLFQLFPFAGLSAVTDTPLLVTLDPNPALIDGDLTSSSGINIGPVPVSGDERPRNMGLDFFNASQLNTLIVWVDRALPSVVVNALRWDIYISSDNMTWTLFLANAPATFGPFDNKFTITIPNVSTRYIKIVTSPLPRTVIVPPGFNVSNIFVTELQAFLSQNASNVPQKTSFATHFFELGVRTRILDTPTIYHNLYFWYTSTTSTLPGTPASSLVPSVPGVSRYIMSNSVTLMQRLSRVFTTTGNFTREDSHDSLAGGRVAHIFSAALTATPFRTLTSSLVLSGRNENAEGETTSSRAAFLNTTAQLYTGISLNFNGGLSTATSETDQKTNSTILNVGLNIAPRSNLGINLNHNSTVTKETGGGLPDSSTTTSTESASISYSPFEAVYLFAAVGYTNDQGLKNTTQSYAVSWAPLRGGALELGISYTEELNSENNGKTTSFNPSLMWNITQRSSLTIGYQWVKDSTFTTTGDERVFSTTFRTMF